MGFIEFAVTLGVLLSIFFYLLDSIIEDLKAK